MKLILTSMAGLCRDQGHNIQSRSPLQITQKQSFDLTAQQRKLDARWDIGDIKIYRFKPQTSVQDMEPKILTWVLYQFYFFVLSHNFYFIIKTCLRYNVGEFKIDSQPGFHLYASDFSLQIIVATDFMPVILGTSVALWLALSMTAMKQQQHSKSQALTGILRQNFTLQCPFLGRVALRLKVRTLERRWRYFRPICFIHSHFHLLETEIILAHTSKAVLLKILCSSWQNMQPFSQGACKKW